MSETVNQPSERIDRLARRIYGTERGGTVEALLVANPGLVDLCPIIPGGTVIAHIPDVDLSPADPIVKPWE